MHLQPLKSVITHFLLFLHTATVLLFFSMTPESWALRPRWGNNMNANHRAHQETFQTGKERRRLVMNLSTSFTELLPLDYFHPCAVCPSNPGVRDALMTVMKMVASASLPRFFLVLLHLYIQFCVFLCWILHLPISLNSPLKPSCLQETPEGNNNDLETQCGKTGCL